MPINKGDLACPGLGQTKKAMEIFAAIASLAAGIKGCLRCLSRNEIVSFLHIIIDAAASDPNNRKLNARTIWSLLDHALAYVTLPFTGGIPVYKTLKDFAPVLWSMFFRNDGGSTAR